MEESLRLEAALIGMYLRTGEASLSELTKRFKRARKALQILLAYGIVKREKGKYKFACPYAQRVNRRVKCQRYFGSDLDKIGACLLKCLEVEKKEKCEISESSFVREMKIKYSR